ncbi:MAG: lipopolysaccharide biosynthesis protein [Bacteroidales bacterium]|nr:lipopolysaccharide biosynthesis protein [Bacteroidales bacterium]
MSEHNKKVANATKWSAVTELMAKLITPITSIVLARLLTPEAFGIVATVTMIISFAEIFTDAGFQRYLIQHEFEDDTDKNSTTTVAFWSNLVLSIFLWGIIAMFCNTLASFVGNPGLGYVIVIACASIPLAAFSSIQMALFKRDFDFKTLFYVRLAGILIPLIITVPLALYFRNFWALIIGTITVNTSNAVILTLKSKWKPNWYYNFSKLKEMLSFSIWTMIDAVLVWATCYLDIFFIGMKLNSHYLGIYKTSISTVGQITSILVAVVTPVLFSSLSRLQNNLEEFKKEILKFQKGLGLLLMPLGVGIFFYSGLITQILLGNQWGEASEFIGIWGLMSAITILFSQFCSIIYPTIGKPRLSVLAQTLHLIVLVPTIVISINYGFRTLYISRSLVRIEAILVNMIITYVFIKLSAWKMIKNLLPELFASTIMGLVAYSLLMINNSIVWSFMSVLICIIIYFTCIMQFTKEKRLVISIKDQLLQKIKWK